MLLVSGVRSLWGGSGTEVMSMVQGVGKEGADGSMIELAAALMAADWSCLREQCARLSSDVDAWHLDVMDGHFVSSLTIGSQLVSAVRKVSPLPLDVHLMVESPELFVRSFCESGADRISFHWEACDNPQSLVDQIHGLGAMAGIALELHTPVSVLNSILDLIDYVLLLSVDLRTDAKLFQHQILQKIEELVVLRGSRFRPVIEVDGSITQEVAPLIKAAGGQILVAGSSIFGAANPKLAAEQLRMT